MQEDKLQVCLFRHVSGKCNKNMIRHCSKKTNQTNRYFLGKNDFIYFLIADVIPESKMFHFEMFRNVIQVCDMSEAAF